MIGTIRAAVAFTVMAIAILLVIPTQLIAMRTGLYSLYFGSRLCHWALAKALGFRITTIGSMSTRRPLLIASNHVSWTDILIIGATTQGSFIAKDEMEGWPLIGWVAKLQRTLFVNRKRKGSSGEQASDIARRLAGNDAMILFAEGTTADGNAVMPFKSTLFGAADLAIREGKAETVYIQPVTITYTRIHGMPIGRQHRGLISWIGDTDLFPHMARLAREGGFDVTVAFAEPIECTAASRRKVVAKQAEDIVRTTMASALRDVRRVTKAR